MTAYDYKACEVEWQTNLTHYLNSYATPSNWTALVTAAASRTSPQIAGNILFIRTQRHALVLALDLGSGEILASKQINPHPLAIITMSPTYYNGKLFVGAASEE